eukprot:6191054-Pleurochrysis_carterae.AAC.2
MFTRTRTHAHASLAQVHARHCTHAITEHARARARAHARHERVPNSRVHTNALIPTLAAASPPSGLRMGATARTPPHARKRARARTHARTRSRPHTSAGIHAGALVYGNT